MRFAVVNPSGGIVTNVVEGTDLAAVESAVGPCVQETEQTGVPVIGYLWDGNVFAPVPDPEPAADLESAE